MNFNKIQGIIQTLLGDEDYKKLLSLAVRDYEHTEVMLSELETILIAYFNVILFKGLIDKKIDAKEFKIVTEKRTIKVDLDKFDRRYEEFILKVKNLKEEISEETQKYI